MRNFFYPLIVLSFFIFSCSSDDDNNSTPAPIEATITIDVDAIIQLPSGADITNLVNFGQPASVPTSEYLVELDRGQTFFLTRPNGLADNVELFYSRVDFFTENPLDPGVFDIDANDDVYGSFIGIEAAALGEPGTVEDPFFPGSGFPVWERYGLVAFGASNLADIEWKYDIRVLLRVDGVFYGYYFIDPKLKIKRLN